MGVESYETDLASKLKRVCKVAILFNKAFNF